MAKPNRKGKGYVRRTNAVSVTVHSQDGSVVPREVIDEITGSIWHVAQNHHLLINIAED